MWIVQCGDIFVNLSEVGDARVCKDGGISYLVQGVQKRIEAEHAAPLLSALKEQAEQTRHLSRFLPVQPVHPDRTQAPWESGADNSSYLSPLRIVVHEEKPYVA